jgi:hypothetical protein
MGLTIIFGGLLFFCTLGLLGWHFNSKKRAAAQFRDRMAPLENSFELHRAQLFFREQALLKYNFLKYNLSAALMEQPEIQL